MKQKLFPQIDSMSILSQNTFLSHAKRIKTIQLTSLFLLLYFFFIMPVRGQIVKEGKSWLVPPGFLLKKSFLKHLQRFESFSFNHDYWTFSIETENLSGSVVLRDFFNGEKPVLKSEEDKKRGYASDPDPDDEIVSTEFADRFGYHFLLELHQQSFCDIHGKGSTYYYKVICDSIVDNSKELHVYLISETNKSREKLTKIVLNELSIFKGFLIVGEEYYDRLTEQKFPLRKLKVNATRQAEKDRNEMKWMLSDYQKDSLYVTRLDVMKTFCELVGEDNLPKFKQLFARREFGEILKFVEQCSRQKYFSQCSRLERIWNESQYSAAKYLKLRNGLMKLEMDQDDMLSWMNGSTASNAPMNLSKYSELVVLMNAGPNVIRYYLKENYFGYHNYYNYLHISFATIRETDDQFFPDDLRPLTHFECLDSDTTVQGFIYSKATPNGYDSYFALYNKESNDNWTTRLGEISLDVYYDENCKSQLFGNSVLLTLYEGSKLLIFDSIPQEGSAVEMMKSLYFPDAAINDSKYRAVAKNISFARRDLLDGYGKGMVSILNWSFNPKTFQLDTSITKVFNANPIEFYNFSNWDALPKTEGVDTAIATTNDQILDKVNINDGRRDSDASKKAMDQLTYAHQFAPQEILYKVNMKISDLNHDGVMECYRYSISNGKLIDVDCFTLVNNEPVAVSREQAESWLMGEYEFRTLALYSQLRGNE